MKIVVLSLFCSLLLACASSPPVEVKAADPADDPAVAIGEGLSKEKPHGAVKGLIYDARSQRDAGLANQSLATAERALRLYPEEYEVWALLIDINLELKQWQTAEQLCNKLLGKLKANDYRRANVWNKIAQAREGRGEIQSASQARKKAAEY